MQPPPPPLRTGLGCSSWAQERPTLPSVRVLVCGGPDFHGRAQVWTWLNHLVLRRNIHEPVHAGGPGVAELAQQWAVSRGVPQRACLLLRPLPLRRIANG